MRQLSIAFFAVLFAASLFAEEGMWTFDNLPLEALKEKYDFAPSQQWLDHLRLSCTRFSDGGSGSFISPDGLVLTNHHVALEQLQKSSSAQHDYIRDSFYATTRDGEIKSPDLYLDVLISMENVTEQINKRTAQSANDQEQAATRRATIAEIEKSSKEKTGLDSQVVTLYSGGEYWLYRYKRYTDVRIVFAPEQQAAFFGGDPDNFTYPRYDLDMAIFRVYENGKPIHSDNYLKWNPAGAGDHDLVFVAGNPANMQRNQTYAEYTQTVRVLYPTILALLNADLDAVQDYGRQGPEQARQTQFDTMQLQNSIKAIDGMVKAGTDPETMAKKKALDEEFHAKVNGNAEWKQSYGNAWGTISRILQTYTPHVKRQYAYRLNSQLDGFGKQIVQYVAEVKKPARERLSGYQDAQLETLRLSLFSKAPVYPAYEKVKLTRSLRFAQQQLGNDDPFVQAALNGKTPEQVAGELIDGTKLGDPAFRKQLIEGGSTAVDASADPMIAFERRLDSIRRKEVVWMRENVEGGLERAGEEIGSARFAVYGKSAYPDSTFTLRLSYGQVAGYPMNGTVAPPMTTFYGLFDRAASFGNKAPFNLMERFEVGRGKIDMTKAFNFVSTNDISGGNSGSPVVNRAGELVGLIFDGNIESLAGNLIYDGRQNRAVSVHTAGMTEAMEKVYKVEPLLKEIGVGQ
jgi:hypothetical protein